MKILAICGSYRKGKTIDTLIDAAIKGVRSIDPSAEIEVIHLIDKNIKYCKNCMACRDDDPKKPMAKCIIQDDMQEIYQKILEADGYIFATPINCGSTTAVLKTFIERSIWVFSKPGNKPIHGCPNPRMPQIKKYAIFIISSGIVPPILRWFCDNANGLLKDLCKCGLNAEIIRDLYAGAVEKRGVSYYSGQAIKNGEKLAKKMLISTVNQRPLCLKT